MAVGIYLENCVDVQLIGNKFNHIDQPVVARRVTNLRTTGNVATYGTHAVPVGVGGHTLHPLAAAIWRIYLGDKPKEQPMFDLRDCEDVKLDMNSTSSSTLLAAERTKRINAEANTAGLAQKPTEQRGSHTIAFAVLKWVGAIVGTLITSYIAFRFGWNWPTERMRCISCVGRRSSLFSSGSKS